ncbi:retrovirus-related pol polyprotein from transposon TNT 1-94 [Tanacetum coccineum]
MKIKESLNVTFNETPPPSKTSPLVDDDLDEEEAIKVTKKKNLENDIEDETLEIDEFVKILRNLRIIQPKNISDALKDESWITAMQEEVNQFIENDVSKLVPQPNYNQQEGIDYDETYSPVARLESIRILLAYACALDFKLFKMDVKSAFLDDFMNEEVYVAQPLEFIDFEKPNHVYKLKKALYGLKQAPKAWTIHEGRVVPSEYIRHDCIKTMFQAIQLQCLYNVDEETRPRFLLELFSSAEVIRNDDQTLSLKFWELNRPFNISLEYLTHIFQTPLKGQYVYSEECFLESLSTNQEIYSPYQTNIPTPNEIKYFIAINGQTKNPNKIHKHELRQDMRSWDEIIRQNALGVEEDIRSLETRSKNNTCNNDKNLSEIQLEHEKEDELVAVVVKVVHECRHWIVGCMMVVKEIENGLLEEVEKLEWWFEQDIDDEGEEDEKGKGGGEV